MKAFKKDYSEVNMLLKALFFLTMYTTTVFRFFFFFCLSQHVMCENILCFWWFHTPTRLKLLTPTLLWFTFDRLQPCLTLTHSQPRSRRFNCLLLSLVHIHSRCSSSLSSSPLHRGSFSTRVGCGIASVCRSSVRKKGGPSQVCCHRGAN